MDWLAHVSSSFILKVNCVFVNINESIPFIVLMFASFHALIIIFISDGNAKLQFQTMISQGVYESMTPHCFTYGNNIENA